LLPSGLAVRGAGGADLAGNLRTYNRRNCQRFPDFRAKTKIKEARIPYQVPTPETLPDRMDSVLRVIYLIFNEGYFASSGGSLTRPELSEEAIRLGPLLVELLPEPEAIGLLVLMLLQESRRAARSLPSGELVLLDDQDRTLWNRDYIAEGSALVEQALATRQFGAYAVQAAIAAVHANAPTAEVTNWAEIIDLYDVLLSINPSPVVELNRAVAVAMRDELFAGLGLIDTILKRGELANYHLAHSAREDLLRRLDRKAEAAYETALKFAQMKPERRFLERRLRELEEN
jgi:RNA polymerase sigma-70 factor, ECF subfamily